MAVEKTVNKMEMRVMQVIIFNSKLLRCNFKRLMLRIKRESDLVDRANVEPTSFILEAPLNMLHKGRNLESPSVLATVVFNSISIINMI